MERSAKNLLATRKWTKIAGWSVGVFLLLMFVFGFWFSREPDVFWVNRSADPESAIVGFSTTDTLIRVAETLLNKTLEITDDERAVDLMKKLNTKKREMKAGVEAPARSERVAAADELQPHDQFQLTDERDG